MAKKKKGRKARKQANQNLKKMPVGQLLQKGEALLNAKNFRDAIKSLKLAHQKQPENDRVRDLLVQAYSHRENELRRKGLGKEAESIHQQVRQYRPDDAQMKVEDLILFLGTTDLQHALSLYQRYLNHHPPVLEAETILAGSLVETADWKAAAQLPENALIKPELSLVEKAARCMEEADWEAALECLKPVKHRSPWAGIKLLCRAMVFFYRDDDQGMQRALSMIPESFDRSPLIERLKSDPQSFAPLWQGSTVTRRQTQTLLDALSREDFFGAGRILKRLANLIFPQAPPLAIEQLLRMLWPLAASGQIDSYEFIELTESVLPEDPGETLAAKFYYFEFEEYFQDTDDYLAELDREFPNPDERDMAASRVLSESVAWVVERGRAKEANHLLPQDRIFPWGVTSDHPECILFEIVQKALELDPDNTQARSLLIDLPRTSRQAKKIAEKNLQKMVDTLPDDPQPCMALAKLYAEKNAFRKVEACLHQAEQRAPHDEQVREFHALTLLETVDINLHRKKYHLVKTDLDKAEMRCNRMTLPALKARQILFDLNQTGQLSLFGGQVQAGGEKGARSILQRHLKALSQADMLTSLGVLLMIRLRDPERWDKGKRQALDKMFKYQIKQVKRLPSNTLRKILLPEMAKLALQEHQTIWLSVFLERYRSILRWLDDEDLVPVLDVLLEDGREEECLQEIRHRRKTASEPFRTLFDFYEKVIQCLIGEDSPDADAFSDLLHRVPQQHMELFRTAALRLSKRTWGPFGEALRHFNFDILKNQCDCPECSRRRLGGDFDDFDEKDLFDPFPGEMEDLDDPIQPILDMVESFVDVVDLRGSSERVIKKQRSMLMNDHKAKSMLTDIAGMIPPSRSDDLSPEAKILLYG